MYETWFPFSLFIMLYSFKVLRCQKERFVYNYRFTCRLTHMHVHTSVAIVFIYSGILKLCHKQDKVIEDWIKFN